MDDAPTDAAAVGATAPSGERPLLLLPAPGGLLADTAPGFEAEVSSLRPNGTPPRRMELGGPRLSRQQRLLRVGALVALVGAALLTLTAPVYGPTLRALLTPHTPPPLVIHVVRDGLGCVNDVAWSPDGRTLAVAGSYFGCGGDGYLPGQINFYDTRSGRLIARVHPDTAVLAALHAAIPAVPLAPEIGNPDLLLTYGAAIWSPDGGELAVALFIEPNPRNGGLPLDGLLLVDRSGEYPRVLLYASGAAGPAGLVAWDLAKGAPVVGSGAAEAAAYLWGSGGALSAIAALGDDPRFPAVAPPGPIGNPDGGSSFTAWQPGYLIQTPTASEGAAAPEPYLWYSGFFAWSPDERYLALVPQVEALVVPIYPDSTPLPQGPFGEVQTGVGVAAGGTPPPGATQPTFPYVRARDQAMSDLAGTQFTDTYDGWALAWRPDGRVLAAFGPRAGASPSITLYDTATGHVLATLAPVRDAGNLAAGNSDVLRWSPDGTRLLLYSPIFGTICLWGSAQLPA